MRPRLTSFELAWIEAAFDAIYPEGTSLPHGIARLGPARHFDALLAQVPFEQSIGLRAALWIVALAPLFVIGKLATMASLAPGDRARVLDRLLASRVYAVRQLVLGLKATATMLYVQDDAVRAAMTTPLRGARPLVTLRRPERTTSGAKSGAAADAQGVATHLATESEPTAAESATTRAAGAGGRHEHAAE